MAADASAESILTELDALAARLTEVEAYLHIDEARGRVTELEQASSAPGFGMTPTLLARIWRSSPR